MVKLDLLNGGGSDTLWGFQLIQINSSFFIKIAEFDHQGFKTGNKDGEDDC